MNLQEIIELVDMTKDRSRDDLRNIAYGLPILACSVYVAHMEKRHNITILL